MGRSISIKRGKPRFRTEVANSSMHRPSSVLKAAGYFSEVLRRTHRSAGYNSHTIMLHETHHTLAIGRKSEPNARIDELVRGCVPSMTEHHPAGAL